MPVFPYSQVLLQGCSFFLCNNQQLQANCFSIMVFAGVGGGPQGVGGGVTKDGARLSPALSVKATAHTVASRLAAHR
jgi:hypothetical protein